MKHNLKNRPKQLVGKKGWADDSGYWEDDVAKWFEEFEKEVRERLFLNESNYESLSDIIERNFGNYEDVAKEAITYARNQLLKEILGEAEA